MSRIPGNMGTQSVGQTQTTQQAAAGGFKGFMMSIGKGLARAGQAVAHFFGTSVPSFFKSLGQRSATNIATTDKPRSMSVETDAKSESSSQTSSDVKVKTSASTGTPKAAAFAKSVPLNDIDWSTAKGFDVKDSGHGGVVIVDVGGAKAVIKGGGGLSPNEVLGARLARELGLPTPETRLLTREEKASIATQMREHGAKMPDRGGDDGATIVMEFVDGKTLGENKATKKEVTQLAQSLGKWLAFDAVISEQDRFHGFVAAGSSNGINVGNFMVNPKNPGEIIGIDQNVMTVDTTKALNSIKNGDDFYFMGVGQALASRFPGLGLDAEALGDDIKASAQEMLKSIGSTITDEKVAELTRGIGVDAKITGPLSNRLAVAADYALS